MSKSVLKLGSLLGLAVLGTSTGAVAAPKPQIVHINLTDATTDATIKQMVTKSDQESIKPGPVTFMVSNDSKSLVHEMIVVSVTDPKAELPYDTKKDEVIESKIKHLGEASDLPPGTNKSLRLNLKPGNYLLICNQRGHYHQGMWTTLTVTK